MASLKAELSERPLLADSDDVRRYLFASMAHAPAEHVRLLYLDAKNRLIADDTVNWGSATKVEIAPREIVRRALDHGATGLILAHNHPSGDAAPSGSDTLITRDLSQALRLLDIRMLDHLILARGGVYSFRDHGLL